MSKYNVLTPVKVGKPGRIVRPGDDPVELTKAELEQLEGKVKPAEGGGLEGSAKDLAEQAAKLSAERPKAGNRAGKRQAQDGGEGA